MEKIKNKPKKSAFISNPIRELTATEDYYKQKINSMIAYNTKMCTLALLPSFASNDDKRRSLIFKQEILNKIENDHGKIIVENLVINANNWDYVIKNIEGNKDKINLIKMISNTKHFLTIGANRINGYFVVTHYESSPKKRGTLKNLLKNKGDSLNHIGEAALSHLQLP